MKPLREYRIAHVGLKEGTHTFEYDVDGRFFEHFQNSLVHDCQVKVKLELEKKSSFFILNFFIDGTVHVLCDRCMEPFEKNIFGDYTAYVKYADVEEQSDEEEVIYLSRDEDFIDLSQLIYEYINLCLPMQIVHPKNENGDEGCNPEMVKFLKKEEAHEQDPRWKALEKLKRKN